MIRSEKPVSRLVRLGLLAFLCTPALLSTRLEIADFSAALRSSPVIPVVIRTDGESISGIQFDLQYASDAMTLSAMAGPATRDSYRVIHQTELSPGKKRILIVGMNSEPIADGVVVLFHIHLNPAAGERDVTFSIEQLIAVDIAGQAVDATGKNGTLSLRQNMPSSLLTAEGILNSASLAPGPIAPGEMVTILGSGLASTPDPAQTVITLNGTPAAILFAADWQINAVASPDLAGDNVQIELQHQGVRVSGTSLPRAASAPGVFTQDASGSGQALVFLADGSRNSHLNPAFAGSDIILYVTGAGRLLPASARIGNATAPVLSAVEVPGTLGLTQVTVRIPQIPPHPAAPIRVTFGQAQSQTGVTVAVR